MDRGFALSDERGGEVGGKRGGEEASKREGMMFVYMLVGRWYVHVPLQ